jgi:acetyl-CoA/propionyl-CoA carboxylase biotin carboxyl carrier protein
MTARELHWSAGGQDVSCRIEGSKDHGTFHFPGGEIPFRILDATHVETSGRRHRFYVIHDRDSVIVWLDGRTYELHRTQPTSAAENPATVGSGEVYALMPGKLIRLTVDVGDVVAAKQTIAIMESMKMETALVAPVEGRVKDIRFKPGDVVDMGEIVMIIAPL